MSKKLFCIVDMFSGSIVQYEDGTRDLFPTNILSNILVPKCYALDYDTIHFFGNEDYINGIIENCKAEKMTNYSQKRDIVFEVN